MNNEQSKMNYLASNFNNFYNQLWNEIIDTNQANIKQETDYHTRMQLQQKHDRLVELINKQFDCFYALHSLASDMPTNNQLAWQKEYTKALRKYIKDLGGNPSIVNFTLKSDY